MMQGGFGGAAVQALPPASLGPSGDAPMSMADAAGIVAGALTSLDPEAETVEPGVAWVSRRGVLAVLSPSGLRAGFGLRSGLSRTAGLASAIATANQRDQSGHLWIAAGRDDRHWSLLWGLTLPYAWLSPNALQRALFTCWAAERDASLRSRFERFGATEYWQPMAEQAGGVLMPALVLWEQLA